MARVFSSRVPPRTVAIVIAAAVTVCGGLGYLLQRAGRGDRPHVVLIVIDTLRADYLGFSGDTALETPRMNRFAASSTTFTRAYAVSSWTKTSVASYLTGLPPEQHGVFEESGAAGILGGSFSTIAEELRAIGYRTVAVSANPHVTPEQGLTQGFDSFAFIDVPQPNTTESTTATIEQAIAAADSALPTFFYFHYLDPHDPYENAERCAPLLEGRTTDNRAVALGEAAVVSGEAEIEPELKSGRMPVVHELGEDDLEYLKALYRCEITRVDEGFGAVLDALEGSGFLDHALVVLTADHGEEFLEHGRLRHGYQLYQETIRVPLVVRTGEQGSAGRRVDEAVSLTRLFGTILAAAGGDVPDRPAAKPLALGARARAGTATPAIFGLTRFRRQNIAYAISGAHKLIWDFGRGTGELYDLRSDRLEEHPADPRSSPVGRELVAELRTRNDRIAPRSTRDAPAPPPDLGAAEQERLRRLGYVN